MLSPARPVSRSRLYQQVADDLERLIFDGVYPHDSRMPSEQELADQYGVSRNVIREALKRLAGHGLVSIHTGSGTFARRPSAAPVGEAFSRFVRHSGDAFSLAQFYELRRLLEPESARLAAQRRQPGDVQAMQAALDAMAADPLDRAAWGRADLAFHAAIAAATGNPLIANLLGALNDPLRDVIAAGHQEPQGVEHGLPAHQRILQAITDQDAESAFEAMYEHLLDSEARAIRHAARRPAAAE